MRKIIISSEVLLLLLFLPLSVPQPTSPPFFVALVQQDQVGLASLAAVVMVILQTERTGPTTSSGPSAGENTALSWSHLAKSCSDKLQLACLNVIVSSLITSLSKLQVLSMGWFIRWMGDIDPKGLGDVLSALAGIAMNMSFSVQFST